MQEMWFSPWVGKIPWRRKWQPTPVFLRGEVHGRRSLVNYSPEGHKESDTTERLTLSDIANVFTETESRELGLFITNDHGKLGER